MKSMHNTSSIRRITQPTTHVQRRTNIQVNISWQEVWLTALAWSTWLGIDRAVAGRYCEQQPSRGIRYSASTTRLASSIFTAVSVLTLHVREFGARRHVASRCRIRKIYRVQTDQPYAQFCVFSTFRDKIKRLKVVCRLDFFCPKMTVGHRESAKSHAA